MNDKKCCRLFSAFSTFVAVEPFFLVTDLGQGGGWVRTVTGGRGPLRRLKPTGWGWPARWACCPRACAGRRDLLQAQGPAGRPCHTRGQRGPPDEGSLGPGSGGPGGGDVPQLAVRRAQCTRRGLSRLLLLSASEPRVSEGSLILCIF